MASPRIAVVSPEGYSLSWWARMRAEGTDVRVYINSKLQKHIGDGIVPKFGSYEELVLWASQGPTTFLFDESGMGDKAHQLSARGAKVVGAGGFCSRLEDDRAWAQQVASACGMRVPRNEEFSSITEAIAFLHKQKAESSWYWKTDTYLAADATHGGTVESLTRYLEYARTRWRDTVSCILQEKIEGVAISTAGWWNGKTWLYPLEGTLEHKKHLNGDLGPATGCALNALWFYDGMPKIAKELHFETLGKFMASADAPPGIYDINSVVSRADRKPYFLEFTARMGYDSEPTSQRSLKTSLTEFVIRLGEGTWKEAPFRTDTVQTTVRLSIPPYPWSDVEDIPTKKQCVGTPVWGADGLYAPEGKHFIGYGLGYDEKIGLQVVDPCGFVGLVAANGLSLQDMSDEIINYIEDELDVPGLQYRTDFAACISHDLEMLKDMGYQSHPKLDLEVD